MPSDKPAVVTDQTDQGHDFRGPGRRLGTNEDAKENTKENSKEDSKEDSKVTKEEVPKNTIEDKSKDQTDEASEGVMVDVDDISDPEIRTHNPPGAPYPPHNAGKSIKKKTVTGLRSEVKTLYEGPRKCVCCVNWVEKPPADAHAAMKSSGEHGDYALLVRRTAHGKDRAWRIQSMMIYSPYIMEMLRTTLDRYPGIALALDQLSIDAPFKAFLHRWDAIVEALQKDDDLKARNHYNLFRQVIEPELKPHLKARDECEEHAVIPYGSMWTIFKPNELVWWEAEGQSNIGRMTEAHYSNDPLGLEFFSLTCEQVEWSGENFGITKTFMNIHSFEGTRPVLSLPVVPVRFKPNTDGLYHQHLSRGRKFEALRGYHFKAYHGPALGVFDDGSGYKRQTRKIITDRVVIDASSYYHFQAKSPPVLLPLDPIKAIGTNVYDPSQPGNAATPPTFLPDYTILPAQNQPQHGRSLAGPRNARCRQPAVKPKYADNRPPEIKPLKEEQLVICVPWVKSFALKEKRWYELAVDFVEEITWNDSFSNLVLPHQEKDLLLAFAQSKISAAGNPSTMNVFDDFIDGKGRGVIILLSGSPGVGKTLTAESIAEKMKVPLYTLSAGEIGIMPNTVEREIKSALGKCTRWNAILLLDEADVFLEKRELNSLKRNELVSIFLRLMEYYEGMMFLTTNRVSTIDPAFESRIDVSIDYPDLTADLRLQIWKNFLFRSEGIMSGVNLSEEQLTPLAELNLNGRQIKSAVKTAQLLATSKGEKLEISHLRAVLRLHRVAA